MRHENLSCEEKVETLNNFYANFYNQKGYNAYLRLYRDHQKSACYDLY